MRCSVQESSVVFAGAPWLTSFGDAKSTLLFTITAARDKAH